MKKIRSILFQLLIVSAVLAAQSAAPAVQAPLNTTELERLWHSAVENNGDVRSALHTYESACLSLKTLNGSYAPSVSTSAASSFPQEYDWKECPDSISSTVSVTQPLPGGTTVGISGTYSLSAAAAGDAQYVSQAPKVAITLSQSLFPFWAQGKLRDPAHLSLEQTKAYYYNQLLYEKQQKLETVTQYYILSLIYRKKVAVYEASIAYRQEQIDALRELKEEGGTSLAKIAELESSQWNDEQNMSDVRMTYEEYVRYLKNACCVDDIEMDETELPSDGITTALSLIDKVRDPCAEALLLKIDMLKTSSELSRQSSAPVLGLSLEPGWSLETVKAGDWKSAWSGDTATEWTAEISLNLTPFISSIASKTGDEEKIKMQSAQNAYDSYMKQKSYVNEQYASLAAVFEKQRKQAEELCKETDQLLADSKQQLDSGAISRLDYDSIQFRKISCHTSLECMTLYAWLYTWLENITE